MNILVQKYGGTSLNSAEKLNLLKINVSGEINKGKKIVLVTSAIGRFPEPYATDTLKSLIGKNTSPKEIDRLLACGEIISSVVLADYLLSQGIRTVALGTNEIGIFTTKKHTDANIIEVNNKYILSNLDKYDVVVVPGFQGLNENGDITTLGRGGSDTTALALAKALSATSVDIISDVKGIYTCDPKLNKGAKLYNEVGIDFLIAMSRNGARVLHYKAAIFAKENNIKIRFFMLGCLEPGTIVNKKVKKAFSLIYIPDYAKINFMYPLVNLKEENRFESNFFIEDEKCYFIEKSLKKETVKYNIEKNYVKLVMVKCDEGMLNEEVSYVKKEESILKLLKKHEALSQLF